MTVLAPNGRPARLEVRARYEAAIPSRKRGYVWEHLDDNAWDFAAKSYTLDELSRISCYLYKNDPIIHGLIERIITDTIGCGIMAIAASSDRDWNRRAKELERSSLRYPLINRRAPSGLVQRIILRHVLLEGNIFQVLVDEPEVSTQLIRSHHLKSIQRDRFGRPTSYTFRIRNRRNEEIERRFPAAAIVHWQNCIFADAEKGVPVMASALNTARDMAEIISFEKDAVKDASSRTDIIETPSGTAPTPSTILSETFTDENGEQSTRYYEDTWRSRPLVLRSGDKYTPYIPQRPSPAWQGFMDWLASAVCLSIGYPPAVALGNKIGGVDSRRDLATAQRTIEPLQEDFTDGWRRVRNHLLAPHVEDGGALAPAPDDWTAIRWQFPKPKTADYGREAQQDREDVREGLMTREEWWARMYQDPDEQESRIIEEAVERKRAIEAAGLTLDEFRQLVDLHATRTSPQPDRQDEPLEDQSPKRG